MLTPKNSYLISNRSSSDPDGTIGPVTFQTAPNHMDRRYKSGPFSAKPADAFIHALTSDLAAEQGSVFDVAFYVHGFGTSEFYGRTGFEQYGLALTGVGFDRGILVGVSWPSNTWTYGGAQTNASNSTALVSACGVVLSRLRSSLPHPVRATFLCHSMGNYLLSTTLAGGASLPQLDSLFMLAADVDYDLWNPNGGSYPQGQAIQRAAKHVYVFYTTNDTVLRESGIINDETRLGYSGAKTVSQIPPNVSQFDYSAQGNYDTCKDFVPYSYYTSAAGGGSLVHSSSKFDPDVVNFTRVVMQSAPPRFDLPATNDPLKLMAAATGHARGEPAV